MQQVVPRQLAAGLFHQFLERDPVFGEAPLQSAFA